MTALDFSMRPSQFVTAAEKKAAYDLLARRIDFDLAAIGNMRRQNPNPPRERVDRYLDDADKQVRLMLKMQVAPRWEDWKNSAA